MANCEFHRMVLSYKWIFFQGMGSYCLYVIQKDQLRKLGIKYKFLLCTTKVEVASYLDHELYDRKIDLDN